MANSISVDTWIVIAIGFITCSLTICLYKRNKNNKYKLKLSNYITDSKLLANFISKNLRNSNDKSRERISATLSYSFILANYKEYVRKAFADKNALKTSSSSRKNNKLIEKHYLYWEKIGHIFYNIDKHKTTDVEAIELLNECYKILSKIDEVSNELLKRSKLKDDNYNGAFK